LATSPRWWHWHIAACTHIAAHIVIAICSVVVIQLGQVHFIILARDNKEFSLDWIDAIRQFVW
jgi:hypothetical protein